MSVAVTIGGTAYCPESVSVSNSIDQAGMIAELEFAAKPAGLNLGAGRQAVTVDLGYQGASERVFTGWTEAAGVSATVSTPYSLRLTCWGNLARANRQAFKGRTYRTGNGETWTDTTLVASLLTSAGISSQAVAGAGRTLLQEQTLTIQPQQTWLQTIRRIDQVTNCLTFDTPDGTVKRILWPLDQGTPGYTWSYIEDCTTTGQLPMFELSSSRALSQVVNMIVVLGCIYPRQPPTEYVMQSTGLSVPPAAPEDVRVWQYNRPYYATVWSTPMVETPPQYIPLVVEDSLIETFEHAGTLVDQLARRNSLLPQLPSLLVPGNPGVQLGHIVGLQSTTAELATFHPFVVTSYRHEWTAEGATTRLGLTRSDGTLGTRQEILPIPEFALSVGGAAITASSDGFVTQFNSFGPWQHFWSNDLNAQTHSGLDETEYVMTLSGGEHLVPGISGRIRLEVEDTRTRLRAFLEKSIWA